MKNILGLFRSLITKDTGVSSKSFSLVICTILVLLLILSMCFVMVYDVLDGTPDLDYTSAGAFLGGVTTLMAAAGATKVIGDRNDGNNTKDNSGEA